MMVVMVIRTSKQMMKLVLLVVFITNHKAL
jgi:hypothetical protein